MDQTILMTESPSKTFKNSFMEIHKKDGILYCRFSDGLNMDLSLAKECVANRIAFSDKKSYPALIDVSGLRDVSKEAREYMAKQGAELLTAGALLVSSPLSRVLGNLFLKVNKPQIPTMLFTRVEEAEKWLRTFVHAN